MKLPASLKVQNMSPRSLFFSTTIPQHLSQIDLPNTLRYRLNQYCAFHSHTFVCHRDRQSHFLASGTAISRCTKPHLDRAPQLLSWDKSFSCSLRILRTPCGVFIGHRVTINAHGLAPPLNTPCRQGPSVCPPPANYELQPVPKEI